MTPLKTTEGLEHGDLVTCIRRCLSDQEDNGDTPEAIQVGGIFKIVKAVPCTNDSAWWVRQSKHSTFVCNLNGYVIDWLAPIGLFAKFIGEKRQKEVGEVRIGEMATYCGDSVKKPTTDYPEFGKRYKVKGMWVDNVGLTIVWLHSESDSQASGHFRTCELSDLVFEETVRPSRMSEERAIEV